MPIEYCEFSGIQDKCKQWLTNNLPKLAEEKLKINGDEEDNEQGEKKHQVTFLNFILN
jgi:hypothetical protein